MSGQLRCSMLLAWGALAFATPARRAEAGLFDWLFHRRPAPTVVCYQPQASCCTSCENRTIVNYAPETVYSTSWVRVPVTTYQAVQTTDPVTCCRVNYMQPSTNYVWQARRTPQVIYKPFLSHVGATCLGCQANQVTTAMPVVPAWTTSGVPGVVSGPNAGAMPTTVTAGYSPYVYPPAGIGATTATPWTAVQTPSWGTPGAAGAVGPLVAAPGPAPVTSNYPTTSNYPGYPSNPAYPATMDYSGSGAPSSAYGVAPAGALAPVGPVAPSPAVQGPGANHPGVDDSAAAPGSTPWTPYNGPNTNGAVIGPYTGAGAAGTGAAGAESSFPEVESPYPGTGYPQDAYPAPPGNGDPANTRPSLPPGTPAPAPLLEDGGSFGSAATTPPAGNTDASALMPGRGLGLRSGTGRRMRPVPDPTKGQPPLPSIPDLLRSGDRSARVQHGRVVVPVSWSAPADEPVAATTPVAPPSPSSVHGQATLAPPRVSIRRAPQSDVTAPARTKLVPVAPAVSDDGWRQVYP